jgi:hypothetical protein
MVHTPLVHACAYTCFTTGLLLRSPYCAAPLWVYFGWYNGKRRPGLQCMPLLVSTRISSGNITAVPVWQHPLVRASSCMCVDQERWSVIVAGRYLDLRGTCRELMQGWTALSRKCSRPGDGAHQEQEADEVEGESVTHAPCWQAPTSSLGWPGQARAHLPLDDHATLYAGAPSQAAAQRTHIADPVLLKTTSTVALQLASKNVVPAGNVTLVAGAEAEQEVAGDEWRTHTRLAGIQVLHLADSQSVLWLYVQLCLCRRRTSACCCRMISMACFGIARTIGLCCAATSSSQT